MMRALILIAVGLLAGLAATALVLGGASRPLGSGPGSSWLDGPAERASSRAIEPDAAATTGARLAAYRTAAAVTDVAALETTLERAVADASTASVELEIDATLARLAELDAARAAGTAVRLELAEQHVVSAFQSWSRVDFAAAVREASSLAAGGVRRAVLLGVVDAATDEQTSVASVMAALPEEARESFFVDWLVRLAERDPDAAFREALAMADDDAQARAVVRIAAVWARKDPIGALGQAESLPDYLRSDFRRAVSETWAQVDAGGLLDYLPTAPDALEYSRAVQWLPIADPARTRAVARTLPRQFGESLERLAATELIQRDPDAMLVEIRAMPPGNQRDELLGELARVQGQGDPNAASAFLESTSLASQGTQRNDQLNALRNIVLNDPKRLPEVLAELPPSANAAMNLSMLFISPRGDAVPHAELADGLLGWDDTRSMQALGAVLSGWLNSNPDPAVDWIAANGGKLNPQLLTALAESFAGRDAADAAAHADRLSGEVRDDWIAAVAVPYMRSNSSAALEWLGRFQGQPVYERTLRQIAAVAADRHPRMVAQLVAQASAGVQVEAAPSVAAALAGLDVAEAVRWAQSLATAPAREQAILTLVPSLTRSNPAEARRLAETYVSDPTERQRALAIIERAAGR